MLKEKGFTLLETIAVIATIAILTLFVSVKIFGYAKEAEMSIIINDIKVLEDVVHSHTHLHSNPNKDWDVKTRDEIRSKVKDLVIYDKRGLVVDSISIRDNEYFKVNKSFVKENTTSRLNGDFFITKDGEVYYKHNKSARLDSAYFYICKTEGEAIVDVVELIIDSDHEINLQNPENIMAGYRIGNTDIMIFELNTKNKKIVGFLGKYNIQNKTIQQVENAVFPSYYRFIDGEFLAIDGISSLPEFGAFYFKDGVKFVSVITEGCNPARVIPEEVINDDNFNNDNAEEDFEEDAIDYEQIKAEISLDNGMYSRGDIWVNKKRTEKSPHYLVTMMDTY